MMFWRRWSFAGGRTQMGTLLRLDGRVQGSMRVLAWVIVAILLGACATAGAESTPRLFSSGVLGQGGITGQTVYWIDNDRVLFIGHRPRDFASSSGGQRILKTSLLEWNTTTGDVQTLAELGAHPLLCYAQGYVHYHFRRDAEVIMRAGELGKETGIELPSSGTIMNPLTCRYYDPQAVARKVGAGLIPLKEEHGYWGRQYEKTSSIYLKRQGNRLTEQVVPMHGVALPIAWSTYAQSYVFRRTENLMSPTDTSGKLWLLSPRGDSKEVQIPPGPWFGGPVQYGLTKAGIFIRSRAGRPNGLGDAGGYLMRGDLPRKLFTGYIHSFDISPNGCKVAMSMRASMARGVRPDLVAIDICAPGA